MGAGHHLHPHSVRDLIYVANSDMTKTLCAGGSITAFSRNFTPGPTTPIYKLCGAKTMITSTVRVAVDSNGNVYTANWYGPPSGVIYEFNNPPDGDLSPSRIISGSNTQLACTRSVAVDASNNLWVGNTPSSQCVDPAAGSYITEYPAGTSGNAPPSRTLSVCNTAGYTVSAPWGIAFTSTGDIWVACGGGKYVEKFASNASGSTPPIAIIAGPLTGFAFPNQIDVDLNDRLMVADEAAGEVFVFNNGQTGDAFPAITLGGPGDPQAGQGFDPGGVVFGDSGGIYVSDSRNLQVDFFGVSPTGNVAPSSILTSGAFTGNSGLAIPR